jgi:hypothetical protein
MGVAFLLPTQKATNVLSTRYSPQKAAIYLRMTPSPVSKNTYSKCTACCNQKFEITVNFVFYIHCSSLMINVTDIFMIENKGVFLRTP